MIQFNEEEQCFILQDLNTSHGCYVNDTRIQNAAVRLAHGDLIEFGYGILSFMKCTQSVMAYHSYNISLYSTKELA